MDAVVMSAKFAAYCWYTEVVSGKPESQGAAVRFARRNWRHFLPHADKGLGRLLIRLCRTPAAVGARRRRKAASLRLASGCS